ncbi:DgyrCDS11510 [Dimorphilus gyrociliatus]|uniref:DgyrCDS11510 n=1 Tax=Dimorphilus gyrociliatus TaxID=2664684 RepID=A0A7I8W4L3_9ANNE|nr:DgyrCDS11510 [Dimorphilus gyrociliatus]
MKKCAIMTNFDLKLELKEKSGKKSSPIHDSVTGDITPVPSVGNEDQDIRENNISTPSSISLEIKEENDLRLPLIQKDTNLVTSEPIVDHNKSEDTHNKVRPLSKKERKEGQVKRPKSKKREELPKVPQPVKAKPKTREPSPVEREPSLSPEPDAPAFERDWTLPPPIKSEPPPLPKASPIIPPALEDYEELDPPKREISKTKDDHPPPLLEPTSLRAVGDGTKKKKRRERKKLKPPAFNVAPIAKPDIKGVVDPLDYLSKYCIITPDRLPVYARVFEETIGMQLYPYSNVPPNPEHVRNYDNSVFADEQMPQAKWTRKPVLSEKEKNKIDNYILIDQPSHNTSQVKSASDQMVDKINFTNDSLLEKYEKLQGELEKLQRQKIKTILQIAKRDYQQITMKDYKPVKDKKKKKKNKNSSPIPTLPKNIFDPSPNETALEKSERLNWLNLHADDDEIYSRINQNMYSTICEDEEMKRIDLLLRRTTDKLKQVDDRIEDLEDEKKMLLLNSRDIYDINMTKETKPDEFRRRQSVLYQNVHPAVDYEMNFSELEEALQDINNHLITENELKYIYYILDVPGKRRINMQLFSVIAALSEKVAQVDSLVRNLINKFNYEALDIKMEKAKELFYLLDGENNYDVPEGKAGANNLLVELTAGGLTSEHVELVVRKFNRDQTGIIDFLDFLTYIPLFLEIHSRIVDDPLNQERDL